MPEIPLHDPNYRRDLGDGLVLRWATAADIDDVATLFTFVFRDSLESPLNDRMGIASRDYMGGRHPLVSIGEFALVEDTHQDAVVAAMCLMRATWEYDGIPLPVGRPEIVASHPEYRNRGLVRAVFELIHARSAARGDMVQGITGINYYYRQFGYEYALDLGGSRSIHFDDIPAASEGQPEPFVLRPATLDDLPLSLQVYEASRSHRRSAVWAALDAAYLRWVYDGFAPQAFEAWNTHIIVSAAGEAVGAVWSRRARWSAYFGVGLIDVLPGHSLAHALPSTLRALKNIAIAAPIKPNRDKPLVPVAGLRLDLGARHPVYDLLGTRAGKEDPVYAWYVRVTDLPTLIQHIAPALERRLAASAMAGHTGELKITFFRGGLRLAFENGRLTAAEHWQQPVWGEHHQASFPPLTFLQLVFGYRSLAELRYAFPDMWASDEATVLINILFPQQTAWVLPLD